MFLSCVEDAPHVGSQVFALYTLFVFAGRFHGAADLAVRFCSTFEIVRRRGVSWKMARIVYLAITIICRGQLRRAVVWRTEFCEYAGNHTQGQLGVA